MGGDFVLLAVAALAFVFVVVVVIIAAASYKLSPPDPAEEFQRLSAASNAAVVALKAFTATRQNRTPCPICGDTISVYEDKEALVQPGEPPPLRTACSCGACRGTYQRI
ncbi:MAG: hypothetical protein JNK17_14710 [Hydrogenophaga sp.]|nr:hypothetical protein [Hydrogenophaga sp.]